MKVSATDLDSDTNAQITYSLHGPGADEFKLDSHTGGFPELQDQAKNLVTEHQVPSTMVGSLRRNRNSLTQPSIHSANICWQYVLSSALHAGDIINRLIRQGTVLDNLVRKAVIKSMV